MAFGPARQCQGTALIKKTREHDVTYDVMFALDTKVLVAALFSRRGATFWLLERVVDSRLSIAISVAVALEYEDATMIAERVGELKALNHVRARIARADLTKARAVLALIPDQPPLEGDELTG